MCTPASCWMAGRMNRGWISRAAPVLVHRATIRLCGEGIVEVLESPNRVGRFALSYFTANSTRAFCPYWTGS